MELKSDETTGNLGQNVRNNIGHGNLASSCHHNSNRRVEVTAGDGAAQERQDGQGRGLRMLLGEVAEQHRRMGAACKAFGDALGFGGNRS